MDDTNEINYGLKLFNEKADKLFRLSFVETMFKAKTGVSFSGKTNDDGTVEFTSSRRGPDEEAIDAFVLTFRFFIQDNEKSSFRNLAKYYENSKIDSSLKNDFNNIRKEINDFLDKSATIVFKFNNEQLTRRKIMETFLYGELSHSNDINKKRMYDVWMHMPPFTHMIENEFVYTLAIILKGIEIIKEINKKALEQIMN
ncbi:MAG: hypothetical protein HZA10_02185 [Nitrospirae bacterium]|nr:hypothetical protein [Nitrospirota bacterium]